MYGAILGDIIGSRFEFDRGGKTKEFKLFTKEDGFTDDSAMTVAVADGLMKAGKDASVEEIKEAVIQAMQDWGHRYPDAGYGGRFWGWLFNGRNPKPYGSYGNGSAMRVSAAGWLYDSLERTREVARATAEVTHNHPEGIKGAECTVAVMYLGRTGVAKAEIKNYVIKEFGYDFSESLDEMRKRHEHVESCQDSLPKALRSFFDGESYEDVVRNAVSLGGDTDTLAAIAGAMAEAFYGVPALIWAEGKTFLPADMIEVADRFGAIVGWGEKSVDSFEASENFEDNKYIKYAVSQIFESNGDEKTYKMLLSVLLRRIQDGGEAPTPMVDKNNVVENMDWESLKVGESFNFNQDIRLTIDKVVDGNGDEWIPLYTDEEERQKGETTNFIMNVSIETLLREAYYYTGVKGLVINPFGQPLTVPKDIIKIVLDAYEVWQEQKDTDD